MVIKFIKNKNKKKKKEEKETPLVLKIIKQEYVDTNYFHIFQKKNIYNKDYKDRVDTKVFLPQVIDFEKSNTKILYITESQKERYEKFYKEKYSKNHISSNGFVEKKLIFSLKEMYPQIDVILTESNEYVISEYIKFFLKSINLFDELIKKSLILGSYKISSKNYTYKKHVTKPTLSKYKKVIISYFNNFLDANSYIKYFELTLDKNCDIIFSIVEVTRTQDNVHESISNYMVLKENLYYDFFNELYNLLNTNSLNYVYDTRIRILVDKFSIRKDKGE